MVGGTEEWRVGINFSLALVLSLAGRLASELHAIGGVSSITGEAPVHRKKIKKSPHCPVEAQISILQSTGVWIAGCASAFLAHEAYIPVPSLCL